MYGRSDFLPNTAYTFSTRAYDTSGNPSTWGDTTTSTLASGGAAAAIGTDAGTDGIVWDTTSMAVAPTVTDFTSDAIRTDVRAIGTEEMVNVTIPVTSPSR